MDRLKYTHEMKREKVRPDLFIVATCPYPNMRQTSSAPELNSAEWTHGRTLVFSWLFLNPRISWEFSQGLHVYCLWCGPPDECTLPAPHPPPRTIQLYFACWAQTKDWILQRMYQQKTLEKTLYKISQGREREEQMRAKLKWAFQLPS